MSDRYFPQTSMDEQLVQKFRYISLALAIAAVMVGGGYLVAWLTGYMASRGLDTLTMKTNTALSILLLGLGLVLLMQNGHKRPLLIFGWICAVAAMLIGILTFTENIFNLNLGIDQWIAKEPPGAIGVTDPNRMGTPASFSFFLAGGALLLIRRPRGAIFAQLMGFIVFLIGLLGIIGVLYQIPEFYSVPHVTAIAWPTSLSLMFLGLGIAFSRSNEGLMQLLAADDAGGKIVRRLLPLSVLLPLALGYLRLVGEGMGYYGTSTGTGLVILFFIIAFSTLSYAVGLGLSRSQSAQYLAHKALQKSEENFRTLADSMPQLVWTAEPDGRIRYYNSRYKEYRGIDALPDGTFQRDPVLHEDDEAATSQAWQQAFEKGGIYQIEHRLQRADGMFYWHLSRAIPVHDDQGRITRWYGTATDIDVSKRAEEALRENEERFREAFEHAPVGMGILEINGRFIYVNDAFCRMVGYSREQLLGDALSLQQLTYPDDLSDTLETQNRLVAGEIPAYFLEKRYIRSNGEILWVRASASMHRDTTGHPRHIISLVEDITPRKKAEEDLRQAQKMEAIGRLAGGVAHEFNNMLNVIIGYAEILSSCMGEDSPLNKYVQEIQAAAHRSAKMTNQLLAYSRKQMVQPEVIDLNVVIENQSMMLGRLIRENIRIRFKAGSDIWPVWIDPSQIDQILANLTVNARDAIMSTGEITIDTENATITPAESLPDLPPGDYVRLRFSDTGVGMDKNVLEHIFDPYFTTKEVGKGTGLGLATVYGIVKQNNGAIFVDSEPGRGTMFSIYFPKSEHEEETEAAAEEARETDGSETVLVVEDELQVLNIAEIILKDAGYRVLKADSPGEAIRIAQWCPGKIDLLLTDVIMPEMNGRALQAVIEELKPGIRTLLMSGYADDEIDRQALRGRTADLVRKPFTGLSLTEKVRDVLDGK